MPLPSSQDVDARFAVFLNPIRDLTKNWEVDIAKYLEEYLDELSEVQITFDGGETLMNFAEAAMLIQGSATIYCKKVEFLWQMVLQMLELLSSKRKFEVNSNDEVNVQTKSGKDKEALLDETVNFRKIDKIVEGKNITLKADDEDDTDEFGRRKPFAFLPATPLHLVEKDSEKSKNRVNLYLSSLEVIGGKDDFRLNRSYITPSGVLCLDLPQSLLLQQCSMSLCTPVVQVEQAQNSCDLEESFLCIPAVDPLSPPLSPPPQDFDGADDNIHAEVDLPQLPVIAEEECKEDDKESVTKLEEVVDVGRHGRRRRTPLEAVETVPQIKLNDPWKPMDLHEITSPQRPVRAGRMRRPPPCTCHKMLVQSCRKRKNGPNTSSPMLPVDQHILMQLPGPTNNNNNKTTGLLHPAIRDQALEEAGHRAELQRLHGDTGLRGKRREDAVQPPVDDCQDELPQHNDASTDCEDDDDVGVSAPAAMELPDPHTGLLEDEGGGVVPRYANGGGLNDTMHYEPDGEYEALVQKWVADYIVNAQEYIASSDLTQRVNRWRSRVAPALAEEEERQTFDIHSYGSRILSVFSHTGETVPFAGIVAGLSSKEVARMFLSSLMLSNTYNVEPVYSSSLPLAMDCLSLRLLSRTRHHEQMQDYVAPSTNAQHEQRVAAAKPKAGRHKRTVSYPSPRTNSSSSSSSSSNSEDEAPVLRAINRSPLPLGLPLPGAKVAGILEGLGTDVCSPTATSIDGRLHRTKRAKAGR